MLLYNTAGGPSAAADAVAAALPDPMLKDYVGDLRAALDNFGSPDDDGPRIFAKQMRSAGDNTEEDVLAQDAVSAVIEFWDAFD